MKNKRILRVESPFADLNSQMLKDEEFASEMNPIVEKYEFEWDKMIPKVTYDDWIICEYKKDGKLYFINLDTEDNDEVLVHPVNCVHILEYDKGFDVINDDSTKTYDDFFESFCSGETDDCSCYAFFNTIE